MSEIGAWMPLYIGDYRGDTAHLTLPQHGAYLLLLMHQWRVGFVPNDARAISVIIGVSQGAWLRSIAPAVLPFFDTVSGNLVQKRLHRERENALKLRSKRSEAAAARWHKEANKNNNMSDASAYASASVLHDAKVPFCILPSPSPSQSPSPSPRKKRKGKNQGQIDQTGLFVAGTEPCDFPDWLPRTEWTAFVEMRKKLRKPLTAHAQKLVIRKLDEFRKRGFSPAEALNNSVLNGWQGIFEPRPEQKSVRPKLVMGDFGEMVMETDREGFY